MDEALSEARRLKHAHTLAHVLLCERADHITGSPRCTSRNFWLYRPSTVFRYFWLGHWHIADASLIALGQATGRPCAVHPGVAAIPCYRSCHKPRPRLLLVLAEAYATLGQPGRNRLPCRGRADDRDHRRADTTKLSLYRVPGDLLNAAGDRSGAERHYRQAIAVAERQSAKLLQLRASTSLPGSGATRAGARKPMICSRRSTTGSPKALMRRT